MFPSMPSTPMSFQSPLMQNMQPPPPLLVHGWLPSWPLSNITGKCTNKSKSQVKVASQVVVCTLYCLRQSVPTQVSLLW